MKLPNLELLVYKAQQFLANDPNFTTRVKTLKERNRFFRPEFSVRVFPQMWSSTCTGFDITENGEPAVGGCAMTMEYTTVVKECSTDYYVVFFGDRACYEVNAPTAKFLEDLRNENMASLSEARRNY